MILGLCGAIQAGKSTCANYLCENYEGYKQYSFADALKESCAKNNPDIPKEEFGWTGKDWSGLKTEPGRVKLQEHGQSERDKNINCWLDITFDKIAQEKPDIAIIPDCRHINEIQKVIDNDGMMVYISRESKEEEFIQDYVKTNKIHPSECSWRLWMVKNVTFMTRLYEINPMTILTTLDNNETMDYTKDQLNELDYRIQLILEKVH